MSDEITYRLEFVLHPGLTAAERDRLLYDVVLLGVHPEHVEVEADGRGAVLYTEPPVDVEERAVLMRWMAAHPWVRTHAEHAAPVAGLEYEFTSRAAPVQAEGTLAGRAMYFRARGDGWSFAVSEDPRVEPSAIESPEAAEGCGWFRGGSFPEPYAGSRLPIADAETIIRVCAREYLYERMLSS